MQPAVSLRRTEGKICGKAWKLMEKKMQGKKGPKEQAEGSRSMRCQLCGRTIDQDTADWEADDEGVLFCRDCRAERESCGCSD